MFLELQKITKKTTQLVNIKGSRTTKPAHIQAWTDSLLLRQQSNLKSAERKRKLQVLFCGAYIYGLYWSVPGKCEWDSEPKW